MKRKTAIKKLMTVVDRNTANLILDAYRDISGFSNLDVVMFFTHNVTITSYQYQQARMGDHSICITYKEK